MITRPTRPGIQGRGSPAAWCSNNCGALGSGLLARKALNRRVLVREIGEYPVQIGEPQDFAGPGTKLHRAKFGAVLSRRVQRADKLSHSGAIEVRYSAKIQKHS